MIVSIRGPTGAGKSYLVGRLMSALGAGEPVLVDDAPQPAAFRYRRLLVVGRYDVRASGCDAIPIRNWSRDRLFEFMSGWERVCPVVFEGMAISNEVARTVTVGARVVALSTSFSECYTSALARRFPAGHASKSADLHEAIRRRMRELQRAYRRLEEAGVRVERLSREAAYSRVLELLEI